MKRKALAHIGAIGLLALAIPFQVGAQQYTVKDLGPAADWVGGINNKSDVAGTSVSPPANTQHAFISRKGVRTVLGTFGGPNSAAFKAPTERDMVVGKSETADPDPFGTDFCGFETKLICLPFTWQDGVMTKLTTLGGSNGIAFGANNRGQVAGTAENTTEDTSCPGPSRQAKPVVWQRDDVRELPTFEGDPDGSVLSINDGGQAVGASFDCQLSASHALLWRHGAAKDLGNLGGVTNNFAQNISNQGQVVGFSDLPGDMSFHAFLWSQDTGMQDLGTLPGDAFSGGDGNNDKGQVVGFSCNADFSVCHAVLWQEGTMTDLNTLISDGGSGVFLIEAWSIDSRGSIVSFGENSNDEPHVYLLSPTHGEVFSGSVSHAAPRASSEGHKQVLPESVKQMLRQRLGPLNPMSRLRNQPSSDRSKYANNRADYLHEEQILSPSYLILRGECRVDFAGNLTGYCSANLAFAHTCTAKTDTFQCPTGQKAITPQYVGCGITAIRVDLSRPCSFRYP